MISPRSGRQRPTSVTAAGMLLIGEGVLSVMASLILFTIRAGAPLTAVAVFLLAVGVFDVYAGIQVLGLKELGRKIGIVLAAAAAVLSLMSLSRTPFNSVINLLISGFVVWSLIQHKESFTE